mmetsp:Transcript_23352/g.59616  ORF Transcript_23352/g.59616 Transcript_23352/m.59616 type:complete len:355 (-) Transcript_23352:19-1083(-)
MANFTFREPRRSIFASTAAARRTKASNSSSQAKKSSSSPKSTFRHFSRASLTASQAHLANSLTTGGGSGHTSDSRPARSAWAAAPRSKRPVETQTNAALSRCNSRALRTVAQNTASAFSKTLCRTIRPPKSSPRSAGGRAAAAMWPAKPRPAPERCAQTSAALAMRSRATSKFFRLRNSGAHWQHKSTPFFGNRIWRLEQRPHASRTHEGPRKQTSQSSRCTAQNAARGPRRCESAASQASSARSCTSLGSSARPPRPPEEAAADDDAEAAAAAKRHCLARTSKTASRLRGSKRKAPMPARACADVRKPATCAATSAGSGGGAAKMAAGDEGEAPIRGAQRGGPGHGPSVGAGT